MTRISTSLRRFFQSFVPIFTPPFDGLWLVAVLYFFWCFLVLPHSQIVRGNLPDPDDYMYLVQVMDWLKGQGWYDNVQQRLDPPLGVPIHFSRLAQIPIALLIFVFQHFGLPMRGAAQIAALIEPLFLFTALFFALRWVMVSFIPRRWAGASAFVILFSWQLAYEYMPGHVDHHGLGILNMALIIGCLLRTIENPEKKRYALLAGSLLAFGMVIALEVLPCVLVLTAWMGLWAVVRAGFAARAVALYGLAFYVVSLLGLFITRAPALWWEQDVLTYSFVYVLLAMGIAVCCVTLFLVNAWPRWLRFIVALCVAGITGGWFLHSFPALWQGPYGGLDPAVARMILGEMTETKPLIGRGGSLYFLMVDAGSVLVALLAAFGIVRHHWRQQGWSLGLITFLLSILALLTIFYQRRYDGLAQMVSVIPLTIFLYSGYGWIAHHCAGRGKFLAEIGLLLVVGPLMPVLIPAMFDGRSLNTGILLSPAYGIGNMCDMSVLERILRDPRYLGDRPHLILNGIGMGPEILFRTNHSVLSAPYHMNKMGNLDATRFFSTIYPDEAERIVRRRQVDVVVMCRFVPDLYIRSMLGVESDDGKYHPDVAPHMIERLMLNKPPAWLRALKVKGEQDFILYQVLPPVSPKETP